MHLTGRHRFEHFSMRRSRLPSRSLCAGWNPFPLMPTNWMSILLRQVPHLRGRGMEGMENLLKLMASFRMREPLRRMRMPSGRRSGNLA